MNIEVIALCDAATEAQGKLNMLGTFDTIIAQKLPVVYYHCAIALRVRFNQIEKGEHKIKLNLVDEDGKLILPCLETGAKVNFPADIDSGVMNMVFHIQGLKLEKFGKYSFDLAVDGRHEACLPLYLRRSQS